MSNQLSEAVEQFSGQTSSEDYIYELATRAAKSDKAALEELLTHPDFTSRVRAICRMLVSRYSVRGSYEEARDLEQSVYIKVWRNLATRAQLEDRSSFYAWLHRVARNLQLDRVRRGERARGTESVVAEKDSSIAETQTLSVALGEAINQLNFESRIVLGRWVAGVSAEGIAEELGVSIKSVYRMKKKIEKTLAAARIEHPIQTVDWDLLVKQIVESQDLDTIFEESLAEIEEIRSRMQQAQLDIDRQKETTRNIIAELGFA